MLSNIPTDHYHGSLFIEGAEHTVDTDGWWFPAQYTGIALDPEHSGMQLSILSPIKDAGAANLECVWYITTPSQDFISNYVAVPVGANATTLNNFIFGPISISNEITIQPLVYWWDTNYEINYVLDKTTGSATVTVDFLRLLNAQLLGYYKAISTNPTVYRMSGRNVSEYKTSVWQVTGQVIGSEVLLYPNKLNMLIVCNDYPTQSENTAITTTIAVHITPRWSLL
jgi:hypothetical protein